MFLKSLSFILVLLEVLFFFNLLIVVHELGHFLAARWRGAVIEEFGVWFWKPIWRRKYNGVWYSFGSIPLGGFVKLPQLGNKAIEGEAETGEENLPPLRPLDRIIVAFAGPLFSFLLALTLAVLVWFIGRPTSQADFTTTIGAVVPGGPADLAGLKAGDKILTIDGKKVTHWSGPVNSVTWGIINSQGDKIDFVVERDGKDIPIASGFVRDPGSLWQRKPKRHILVEGLSVPEVGKLEKDGPAERAGLQLDDVITAVNGKPIRTEGQIYEALKAAPSPPLHLAVRRGTSGFETDLQPKTTKSESGEQEVDLGVYFGKIVIEHPGPWSQVVEGMLAIRNTLSAVSSPKSDVQLRDMSGPVGIMNVYHKLLSSEEGWRLAISFSVLFNVNLALINLLPFPVLDGGHIMFGLLEMIRRRPANARVLEVLETACVVLILGYVLFVSFFDVGDLFHHPQPMLLPATPAATPAATPPPQ